MDKAEIKEKLLILGIVDFKQFKEGDLRYWWQLKFKELKKVHSKNSKKYLLELNSAYDILQTTDNDLIERVLISEESEEKNLNAPDSFAPLDLSDNEYSFQNMNLEINWQLVLRIFRIILGFLVGILFVQFIDENNIMGIILIIGLFIYISFE